MKFDDKISVVLIALVVVVIILGMRTIYERNNPVVNHGRKARLIAIPSTGKDIHSPVSHLFGRAPYYIICDRLKGVYKSIPNKQMDAPHAAGLKNSQMLAKMKVDVVCANNIGFEPARIFTKANIEMYTNIKGTVWQTFQSFPDSLTKITKQTVPAHFGITGTKKAVACSSFDAQANLPEIVQGKYFICLDCGYKISQTKVVGKALKTCPKCGHPIREVVTITAPTNKGRLKPKVKVF